ncbi:MAG: alginate export family protein, partial [Candidatus Zixiibacteriota bacterium]
QFAEMRTRVGVEAIIDDNTHAFIQPQDSRIAGDLSRFGQPTSGTLNDAHNTDLHQAFVQIDNIFGEGWGGKAGRFEFTHGNERVFGPVGWDNVGRSWEGIMFWNDNPDFKATGFWLKSRELMEPTYNRDFDIFGLYGNVKAMEDARLDLFGFYEYDADTNGYASGINQLDRINLGLYYQRDYRQFDFEVNGVYQFGKQPSGIPVWSSNGDTLLDTVKSEVDIAAFMFTFEVGYSFEGAGNARLAAGIDYSSGDDGSDTTKFKTYQNSYYTGHKFRGYMDYFVPSFTAGLVDLMFRGKVDPTEGWTVSGDLHYFMTAEDYLSPIDTSTTTDVGLEFDLTVTTTRVAGVKLDAGASIFLPQEAFAGVKDPDPGFWAWSMATVNFGK